MNTDLHPHRTSHDLRAFFEFFGSAAVVAVVIFQLLRLVLPADWLFQFGGIIGTFSFLAATGICAWLFERVHRDHYHH